MTFVLCKSHQSGSAHSPFYLLAVMPNLQVPPGGDTDPSRLRQPEVTAVCLGVCSYSLYLTQEQPDAVRGCFMAHSALALQGRVCEDERNAEGGRGSAGGR